MSTILLYNQKSYTPIQLYYLHIKGIRLYFYKYVFVLYMKNTKTLYINILAICQNTSQQMNSNKSHDIIQIDDDNDSPAPAVDSSKTAFAGINPIKFPKLHSMLHRNLPQKTKSDSEKKVAETCLPIPIVETDEQEVKEVCNVVHIAPQIELTFFSTKHQQNEVCQHSNQQFKPEQKQNEGLLVVQENLEPLVQISQVHCQNIDVITQHQDVVAQHRQHQTGKEENHQECPVNSEPAEELAVPEPRQAMIQEEIVNHVEEANTFVAWNQEIVRPQVEQMVEYVHQDNNPTVEVNQLEKAILDPHNTVNNNEELIILGQPRDQTHEKPQEDEGSKSVHEDSLIYLNEHPQRIFQQETPQQNSAPQVVQQSQPQVEAEPSSSEEQKQCIPQQPEEKETYDIAKIKEQILLILPDIAEDIQSISDKEIIEIYKEAKPQIDESLKQIKESSQPNLEHESKEVMNEPIQEIRTPQKLVVQEQSQQIEQPQPQPAHKQPEERQQHHIFYALRGCDEQELRAGMVKYFPEAKDALMSMNYQQLKDLLDEALLEIDKGISSQPEKDTVVEQKKPQAQETQKKMDTEEDYMKNYLIEFYPELRSKIQGLDVLCLRELYRGVKKCEISKEELGRRFDKFDKKQADKSSILELCIQKYPHLADQLKQLTEQQLDKFINDARTGFGLEPRKKATVEKTQPSPTQRLLASSTEANGKKTPPTTAINPPPRSEQNNTELRRAKRPINYREKILKNLPHLRDNIMKLDDKEVQNLYKQCLQAPKPQTAKGPVFEEPVRPVIKVPHPQKTTAFTDKRKSKEDIPKEVSQRPETIDLSLSDKGKTSVYELSGDNKKRKTRTILLMHTEEVSDEEQQDTGFKVKRTADGIQRKWNCECLQSVTVSDLLKRLSEMVEKKN